MSEEVLSTYSALLRDFSLGGLHQQAVGSEKRVSDCNTQECKAFSYFPDSYVGDASPDCARA